MSELHNAKITGTMLGFEDHGIMTFFIYLEWAGAGIGFGGYALDAYDKVIEKRVGVGVSLDLLKEIMEVVGVEKWEDLKGQYVRVKTEGWGGKALELGNLMEEKWINPEEFFNDHS